MKKRLLSLFLTFSMLLTFFPVGTVTVFASDSQSGTHGLWRSDWYVQSFPGACCSRFIEGSAYNKKMR